MFDVCAHAMISKDQVMPLLKEACPSYRPPSQDEDLLYVALALTVWQFVVAMRFRLHQRVADPGYAEKLPSLGGVGSALAGSAEPRLDQTRSNCDRVIIISDADVHVPPDLLSNVVAPLRDDRAGLVSCFYRLANPATLAMQVEAIAINADFWSQVLQAQSLKPLDFALGAVMATTRGRASRIDWWFRGSR